MPTISSAEDKTFQRALQPVETALADVRRQIDALKSPLRSDLERSYKALETKVETAKKEAGPRGVATLKAADKLLRDLSAATAKRAALQRDKDDFAAKCRATESTIERFAAAAAAVKLAEIRASIDAQVREFRKDIAGVAKTADAAKGQELLAALDKRVTHAVQALRNVRDTETSMSHFQNRAGQAAKVIATLRDCPAKKGLLATLSDLEYDAMAAAMRLDVAGLKSADQEANFILATGVTVRTAVEDVERELNLIAATLRKAGNPVVPSESLRALNEHCKRGWPRSEDRETIRREVIAFRSAVERFSAQVKDQLKKAPVAEPA